MLSTTSAFAETRHRGGTENNQPSSRQAEQYRRDRTQTYDRDNRGRWQSTQRNECRSYNRSRSYDRRGGTTYGSRNEPRHSATFEGRVSRIQRYNSGYRVWLGRGGYPFFIPAERWSRFPLRVGVSIRLGGYWDPLGYYNVYDVGPYSTSGDLHGIVESVDYRRGTVVLRDDVSGSFVTAVLRGNDPRLGDLRQGDHVDLTGTWNRSGVFDAYNLADLRDGGYGRY